MEDIDQCIRQYAKHKKIPEQEYESFKLKIVAGLVAMGLPSNKIDIDKYKEVAKCQKKEDGH